MDSPKQASDALSALEGAAQDSSKVACASLEDGAPTGGPPNVDQAVSEAPTIETTIGPLLQIIWPRARLPNKLMLGSYVKPMEWSRSSVDTPAPGSNETRPIVDLLNPLKKKDSSAAHMRDLYPNLLRLPVAARAEEYSIPFLIYMDKKFYQLVAEDGMFIHNHDFDETAELV